MPKGRRSKKMFNPKRASPSQVRQRVDSAAKLVLKMQGGDINRPIPIGRVEIIARRENVPPQNLLNHLIDDLGAIIDYNKTRKP